MKINAEYRNVEQREMVSSFSWHNLKAKIEATPDASANINRTYS